MLLKHLPLRDDYQENEAVIKCFFILYQQGSAVLRAHLSDVIRVVAEVLHKKQTPNEGKCVFLLEDCDYKLLQFLQRLII